MKFNPLALQNKEHHLDAILQRPELLERVLQKLAAGRPVRHRMQPRPWNPGGGSTLFHVELGNEAWFLKVKHLSVTVESQLESEAAAPALPSLRNELDHLTRLEGRTANTPQRFQYVEEEGFGFLLLEPLSSFHQQVAQLDAAGLLAAWEQLESLARLLHRDGIVHTDIHELNIMFRGVTPVLVDFEEARALRQSEPFEESLDVTGLTAAGDVGDMPEGDGRLPGRTCLNRLREVFKRALREQLPALLKRCNFDSSCPFLNALDHGKDERIYQSINIAGLQIAGQRPVADRRIDTLRGLFAQLFDRPVTHLDIGANLGRFNLELAQEPNVALSIGIEAYDQYVDLARALAFLTDNHKARFVCAECGNQRLPALLPVKQVDVVTIYSVYHHIRNKAQFLADIQALRPQVVLLEMPVQSECYEGRTWQVETGNIAETLGFAHQTVLGKSEDYERPIIALSHQPLAQLSAAAKPPTASGQLTGRDAAHVRQQLLSDNAWYTASQFAWAEQPFIRPIYQRRREFISACLTRLRQRTGRQTLRVLDAGCGDGYWLHFLDQQPGIMVVGLDYNELRVGRARQAAPNATVHLGSLFEFKSAEPFDLILLSQVIEHVQEDEKLLRHLRSQLRPDGVLVLGTPNEGSPLHQARLRETGALQETDHCQFYREPELRRKIAAAGFGVGEVMREIFYLGDSERTYELAATDWGFALLEFLTQMLPGECSDYYFECLANAAQAGQSVAMPSPKPAEIREQLVQLAQKVLATGAAPKATPVVKEASPAPASPQPVGRHRTPGAPRVSVVLPTYNHARLLPQAIASVLDQTFSDFELIIVNDGSTDGTRALLDQLQHPRVRVIHQENQRLPGALNNGFAAARGELLTWTSADNWLAPTMLEVLVAALDAHPDAGMAVGAYGVTDEAGRIKHIHRAADLSLPAFFERNPGIAAFLYRAECQQEVGAYDPALDGAEDWDMWFRIAEKRPLVNVPDVLYYYREHGDSMTARIPDRVLAASRLVIERAFARRNGNVDLEELYPALRRCRNNEQAVTHAAFDLGTRLLRSPFAAPQLAARFLAAAFERDPAPPVAANLMIAFARSGDGAATRQLIQHLEHQPGEQLRQLVTIARLGDPAQLQGAPLFTLNTGNNELLQLSAAEALRFSPTSAAAASTTRATTAPDQSLPNDLEATIREALELNPDGIEALQLLAMLHLQRREWPLCAKVGQRLLQLEPENVKSLLLLAHCFRGAGDPETAIAVYQRVLALQPDNATAREILAELGVTETGTVSTASDSPASTELNKAEQNIREVLHREPNNLEAWSLLGQALMAQERWAEAIGACNRLLKEWPRDLEIRARLATCHWQLGAATTAELLFEELLEEDPQNAAALAWREASSNGTPAPVAWHAAPTSPRPAQSPFTEEIACPFCASREATRIRNAADIVECGGCHTVYLRTRMTQERMEELYQTYADDGSHMAVPKSLADAQASNLKRDYFFQEILAINDKRGRILDVGCGWGAFLLNARDQGFEPSGMELTRKAVGYANEALGIPVVNTQFLDTPYDTNSHQVITMLHVLEHLPHPQQAIAKVFATLQPGGLFCGIVPNFASFCSRHGRDHWYWLDPNYHYVHYTPETLRRHLEAAGFIVERIYTALGDYGYRMHREVASRMDSRLQDEAAHRDYVDQLCANGQGEEIRFFVRKPEHVPAAKPAGTPDNLVERERLTHLLDLPELVDATQFNNAVKLVAAALACSDAAAFAQEHGEALDRIFFGLLDLHRGNAIRNNQPEQARQINELRSQLSARSSLNSRKREAGWSFCFITNGKRPEKLRAAIESVQALQIPACEILVGGEAPEGLRDAEFVPVVDAARNGRLGEMRNRLLERARFDHLVIVDDDITFKPDFFTGIQQFGDDFEVLCVRLLNPDGTRYWDWATNDGPRGHKLLPYDQNDPHVYVTGGLCIMKAEVGDRVRWSESLGFYQGEDADFSKRLHAAGISIRCNPHSTALHRDPRYTSLDGIILDADAVRQHARDALCRHQEAEAKDLCQRLAAMDPAAPAQWDKLVLGCLTAKTDGRYTELASELFQPVTPQLRATDHFAKTAKLVAQLLEPLGPFYFHCGGAGDALLLLASFYDKHPDAVVVSMPNSIPAMKSFFEAFPKLKHIVFLPPNPDPNYHLLVRMLMKLLKNCRGVGVTPYQEYSEWNPGFDIFRHRKVVEHPAWAGAFRQEDRAHCVTLSPKGSLTGMVGSKRNQIDPAFWATILRQIIAVGLQPVILGTPNEAAEYPAIEGALDQRSFSFGEQMEWIASSRAFVGADSWGKSFAALAGVPTIVFDSMRGADWTGRKDASDFVFIDPWKDIVMVRSLREFEQAFKNALARKAGPAAATRNTSRATAPTPVNKSNGRLEINWLGSFLDYGSLSHINRVLTDELVIQHRATVRRVQTATVNGKLDKPLQSYRGKLASRASETATLTVRHAWPPDWSRPAHGKLAVIQPWEFGSLPRDWVQAAATVDAFWVPSNYVRQVYIDSGVPAEKVHVLPNGIDPKSFNPQARPLKLATRKSFKLLFVGGTIHRKGPDVLLKAYCETFTAQDDVCLVIKDFGGGSVYAGQTLEQQIRELRTRPNAPEILYLNQELKPQELPGLYTACDCLVHPYRGEGFGLPVLEAMACGRPVIVTSGGSTDDFVPAEAGYHIPSVRKTFGREISGMPLVADGWLLEPDLDATKQLLRRVFSDRTEARAKGNFAARHAREHWTWQQTAARLHDLAQALVSGNQAVTHQPAAASRQPAGLVPAGPPKPKRSSFKIELPDVAKLGHLGKARELLQRKQLTEAWQATLDAIAIRPFHPEAWLLLAEIASTNGDAPLMKTCAGHALALTTDWKPAKQFLKTHSASKQGRKLELAPLPDHGGSRLTVCLIARNEEKFIGQCLGSIKGIAQQIVVVDTGSTDRTVELANQHGAEVHHFTWCDDFSAARNAALAHATGDWVLVLDADEELPARAVAELRRSLDARNVIGWRLPIVDTGREDEGHTYVPRLFRNAPGLFYVSRVHEQVFSSVEVRREEWNMEIGVGKAALLHHGYTTEMVRDRNKVARNLRLLELAIEEIPGDANLLMNYGLELVRSGRLKDGLARYTAAFNALTAAPLNEVTPELRETLVTQFSAHLLKAKCHAEIIELLTHPAATHDGLSASLHFTLGLALQELQRWPEAAEQFRQCLAKRDKQTYYLANKLIRGGAPRHCLALALWKSGELDAAAAEFAAASSEDPALLPLKMDYARFLEARGEPVEALQQLHAVVTTETSAVAAWVAGGKIALSDPHFIEFARDWTAEAIKHHSDQHVIVSQRAELLLVTQQYVDALPLWQQLNGHPRAIAARVLCELMQGEFSIDEPPANEREASQEFLNWYRRLVSYRAAEGVHAITERLELLRPLLPSAAQVLERLIDAAAVEAA